MKNVNHGALGCHCPLSPSPLLGIVPSYLCPFHSFHIFLEDLLLELAFDLVKTLKRPPKLVSSPSTSRH